jgi:hypothetical protein
MKLVYIVSMFIIILIALISPRKEYFNDNEPCYKNMGNRNSDGSEIIFNNSMLDHVLSKDRQIIKGDSYNDEISKNLRGFERQKKSALSDVTQKEASVAAAKSENNDFFLKQEIEQENKNDEIEKARALVDNNFEIIQTNVTNRVDKKIMQDGQAKLSNTVQDILGKNIRDISLQLSKGESIQNYQFNGVNYLTNKFNSFKIDNSDISVKTDKTVVPVKLLKPRGCYTLNDYDMIQQWSPQVDGCESFGITQIDYWKNNWNNFAVITSVDPGGRLPFATLGGKDVWHEKTFIEKSEAQDYVNSFKRTIFDWQTYTDPTGSFPVRVNPISTNIECLEKLGKCDTSFGTNMSKITNNADTIECKFDGNDPQWCKGVYNTFAKKNVDALNYDSCPKGWSLVDGSSNICKAPNTPTFNKRACVDYKPVSNIPNCNNNANCKKIQRSDIVSLIDNCEAQFKFKPNANAIANNLGDIRESVDNNVKDILGTSTKPISSNVDRFDFNKKGILVKIYEAVKSNGIIVKGPAVGARNYNEGNTVYIVNNINFADSSIILNTKFSEYPIDQTKQVFIEFIGYIKIPDNTEKITFQIESYQGSRFYFKIGDELINVIDSWNNSQKKESKMLDVIPNRFYPFKLEYFLDEGLSSLKLSWKLNNNKFFNIISRDNFFLDSEQCNKLTSMPNFNTTIDRDYKTYPGISGINSFDTPTLNRNKLGDFDTADECALECSENDKCRGFTYSTAMKSCYQFDTKRPQFSKDPKTNSYIKNNTQSDYGSYDNSLEVPMRKMLTITNSNHISLKGLNNILKNKFTIEMWINVTYQEEDIYLFSINPTGPKGEKIIFKLDKNRKLDVDFGYPIISDPIESVGNINPMARNINNGIEEPFANAETSDISPNIWTHVAMSYSNNIVKIFVNGQLKKEIKQGPFIGSVSDFSAFIGSRHNRRYNLNLDEIRIWSIDVNADDLFSFMKAEIDNKHPKKNNLVWYGNLNFIENNQIYNKCTADIGSGCNQTIQATFTNRPIITSSTNSHLI